MCRCSYSECICDIPELNHEPTYKVGQVWRLYASRGDYEIVYMGEAQIVGKEVSTGKLVLFSWYGTGSYANCGTPQLRTLVQDV